jgi:hypothetical protein
MKARLLFLLLLPVVAAPAAAQGAGFLARGNLGYDVIGDTLIFGGGAGYYLPLMGAWTEAMVDLFGSAYSTSSTEGNWRYDETGGLFFIAAHYDYMFGYAPGRTGLYALAGAGFFAGTTWWNEVDTYVPDGSSTPYDGGGTTAGPLFDLGAGYTVSARMDIRLDVPVLVHLSGAISIPIILGVIYRF